MHRSGTSLIAKWLQSCGLNIGDSLLVGDSFSNPDGHYEDVDFLRIHESILKSNNINPSGLDTIPFTINVDGSQLSIIKELIKTKSKSTKPWGWKDPRTCLFLSTYYKLMPDALFLIIFRNPQEVTESLFNRNVAELKSYLTNQKVTRIKYCVNWIRLWINKKKIMKKYCLTWIHYHDQILNYLAPVPEENKLFLNIRDVTTNGRDDSIIKWINEYGLALKNVPIKSIFKKKLLHKSRSTFKFCHKAKQLYTYLESKKI